MDHKTTCPKCGNPNCEADHSFCWNCGLELGNCCENPECPVLGATDEDESVVNLNSEYVYCPYCGKETRYATLRLVQQMDFQV